MSSTLISYSESLHRAKQFLLSKDDWSEFLPSPLDESWRKVDLSGVNWLRIAELIRTGFGPKTESTIEGDYSITSDILDRLPEILGNEIEGELPKPEHARSTTESFFRRDIFSLLNLGFSEPLTITAKQSDQRLTIRHNTDTELSLPSLVLRVPAEADVTVAEFYNGCQPNEVQLKSSANRISCGHTVIIVEPGARLKYVQFRNNRAGDLHFHHTRFVVDRDSYVEAGFIQNGGLNGKSFFQSSVVGRGGEFYGRGLFAGRENQVFQNEMGVQHLGNNTNSRLLYKTVMDDHSHSVFLGSLEIPFGVSKVDSYQLNQNLILAQKARAESRPWLVIRAEDVSCEHGATVGDLDEDALFFLQSRGLPEDEARKLLIQGFLEEVLGEMALTDEEKEGFRQTLSRIHSNA